MSDGLRILHFVPRYCYPVNTGAKLRNYYFAKGLAEKARVTFLSFGENHPARQNPLPDLTEQPLAPLESFCEQVITVPHKNSYSLSNLVRGLVGPYPLTVLNYTTEEMAETLRRTLAEQNFDIVHMESLLLAAYLPILRAAKSRPLVVCDWHNIDSEVLQRYSRHAPSMARKAYAKVTINRLQVLEKQALSDFNGHFVVSRRDRRRLLEINPDARIFVADNGVDCRFHSIESIDKAYSLWLSKRPNTSNFTATEPHRLLFVGSMDYHANVDAVVTFAKEIWPTIFARHPQIKFTIVGRNPGAEIRALASHTGIEVTGTVDDVRPFYKEAIAAVVPLRIGGGSRLKILESMAAGIPVVSTGLGAEGLEVTDRKHLLLAETHPAFLRSIEEVIDNKELRLRIEADARLFVQQHYDWSAITNSLFNTYNLLINEPICAQKSSENVGIEAFEVSA
jgi:polysaccharide biosynthesis protein PslH